MNETTSKQPEYDEEALLTFAAYQTGKSCYCWKPNESFRYFVVGAKRTWVPQTGYKTTIACYSSAKGRKEAEKVVEILTKTKLVDEAKIVGWGQFHDAWLTTVDAVRKLLKTTDSEINKMF